MSSEYIGEDEQSADLVRRYVERNTVSGAGERSDIRAAAERLIRQYDRIQAHVMEKPDILTVARFALDASARLAESSARVRELENEAVVLRAAFSHLIDDHKCEGYTPSKISLRGDAALRGAERGE